VENEMKKYSLKWWMEAGKKNAREGLTCRSHAKKITAKIA